MKVSEQFYSLQGEGIHTGVPSYFIRFFGCSLQCQGFGQKDPANPDTWVQPWKTINIEAVNSIEELPSEVYEYGCDSVYSWSAKFKKLQKEMTAASVVAKMKADLGELFDKVLTGDIHIVWTGGEPLMKFNQKYIIEILDELKKEYESIAAVADVSQETGWTVADMMSMSMTFETNGTQAMSDELKQAIAQHDVTISCSPKLLHTSGEKRDKAIHPTIVNDLMDIANHKVLKFVVANSEPAKAELLEVIDIIAPTHDVNIYLMPEGPNRHRVEDSSTQIAEFAMQHGFRFSDRLHARLWDNKIGV